MRRIALLFPDFEAGGAERVMLLLARGFLARGHQVDLLVVSTKGPLRWMASRDIRIIELTPGSVRWIGAAGLAALAVWRLSGWLRFNHPDVLLSTVTGANLLAVLARQLAGGVPARVVIRETNTLGNKSRFRLWLMRRFYPLADAVVALTSIMAGQLKDLIGVPGDKLYGIPNPVDIDFIREMAEEPVMHPKLQRSDGDKIIVAIGRLVPHKDHETLILAISRLPANFSVKLFIVGDGPERSRLEILVKRLSLEENVIFVGFDMNPWRWLAKADLFVLPSKWEGCPNVLLEALVLGVPAVITEYDASAREMAEEYGFVTTPVAKPELLAEKIVYMLAGSGKCTVKRYSNDYGAIIDQYLSVLFPVRE